MNIHERRVLLLKRAIIADTLNFSPRAQKIYRRHGLLNDFMTGKIMVEPTDFGRMLKFLELLGEKIGRYCVTISQILVDQGHAWLADEIHAEVLAERGQLPIEEYVAREAGMFVRQHLGLPTMLSEMDKKRMQYLIALRFQTAKEAYRLGQERHLAELERKDESEHALRGRIDELLATITVFLKVKAPEDAVNNRLLTMTPRGDDSNHGIISGAVNPSASSQDDRQLSSIHCLQTAVEDLLGIISATTADKESLMTERKRVCHLLNIDKPVANMDIVVKNAVDKASENLAINVRELALHDKMARSLESRVKSVKGNADRHVAVLQKQVVILETSADKKNEVVEELNKELRDVKEHKEVAMDELGKWRSRCQLMEGTRHLGYYHPGWFDELYDADDQLDPDERPADIPSRLSTPLGTPRLDGAHGQTKRTRARLKRNVTPINVFATSKGRTQWRI